MTSKEKDKIVFDKDSISDTVSLLLKNCYFTVGNNILKQDIGIPMGIDPAPFWANRFLYHFETKYFTSLVSACSKILYNFHSIERFINALCVINDRNSFFDNFKDFIIPNDRIQDQIYVGN